MIYGFGNKYYPNIVRHVINLCLLLLTDFDYVKESEFYSSKGLNYDNVYLFVRGHCLYNSLVSLGKKVCEGTGVDFEQNILKSTLGFERYDAIQRIKSDVKAFKALRRNI